MALTLAGSLVPTTLAGHAFWTVTDSVARKLQRIQFRKNMALIGGLLFAVLDRPTSYRESAYRPFRRRAPGPSRSDCR